MALTAILIPRLPPCHVVKVIPRGFCGAVAKKHFIELAAVFVVNLDVIGVDVIAAKHEKNGALHRENIVATGNGNTAGSVRNGHHC